MKEDNSWALLRVRGSSFRKVVYRINACCSVTTAYGSLDIMLFERRRSIF